MKRFSPVYHYYCKIRLSIFRNNSFKPTNKLTNTRNICCVNALFKVFLLIPYETGFMKWDELICVIYIPNKCDYIFKHWSDVILNFANLPGADELLEHPGVKP